ncbi:hypothetical protein PVK06_026852 [Gossypium arboreum]|uniref:GH16 domain-containing protein n=1 Tax=Gossypium arboreum TaxID=29729 RepID=A0ABR0P033_GOSAR|nr:hypothetical protein PVK06_026852 [Gossypium arboreum]
MKYEEANQAALTAHELFSKGSTWDEIDSQFLGNLSRDPYILHTNVFSQGKDNKEQQFYLTLLSFPHLFYPLESPSYHVSIHALYVAPFLW